MSNNVIQFPEPPKEKHFLVQLNYLDGGYETIRCVFFGASPEIPGFLTFITDRAKLEDEYSVPDYMVNCERVSSVTVEVEEEHSESN